MFTLGWQVTRKIGSFLGGSQRCAMSSSLQEKLHEVLYPGEAFTEGRTAALAAKLRQVADELQATSNKHQQLGK